MSSIANPSNKVCVSDFQFLNSNFCHETKNDIILVLIAFLSMICMEMDSKRTFLYKKLLPSKVAIAVTEARSC